jgi:hypothetical protein
MNHALTLPSTKPKDWVIELVPVTPEAPITTSFVRVVSPKTIKGVK